MLSTAVRSLEFWIEIIIAATMMFAGWRVTVAAHRDGKPSVKPIESLRSISSNAVVVMGLLGPIAATLAGYLNSVSPDGNYTSLVSAFLLIAIAIVLAAWHNFSLLKFQVTDGNLTLEMPAGRKYIYVASWIYSLQVLSILYVLAFAGMRLGSISRDTIAPIPDNSLAMCLVKPPAWTLDNRKNILDSWGNPASPDNTISSSTSQTLRYETSSTFIQLEFDAQGRLKILEEKRK